jgi:hypothetical protein
MPWGVSYNMQENADPHYFELNKHKMLHPQAVARKIVEMVIDNKKYRNGDSVDLPN